MMVIRNSNFVPKVTTKVASAYLLHVKRTFFKMAQKVVQYFGFLRQKICLAEQSKIPNLVTLVTTNCTTDFHS